MDALPADVDRVAQGRQGDRRGRASRNHARYQGRKGARVPRRRDSASCQRALPYLERAAAPDADEPNAEVALCTYWMLDSTYLYRSQVACQSALRKLPNNVDVLDSLAWIHYNHKRYADAEATAEQVLRAKPKPQMEVKAKIVIGLSQAARGDCVSARRTLEPLQKLAPQNALIDRVLSQCAPHEPK